MARPKIPADERMETVSTRVPKDMASAIDEYLEKLQDETPLLILNRADALRQLLAIGLQNVGLYDMAAKSQKKSRRK
jgi:hypothetical protein